MAFVVFDVPFPSIKKINLPEDYGDLLSLKPFYHRYPAIPGMLLIAGGLHSGLQSNLVPFHCFQIKCTMVASCGLKLGRAFPFPSPSFKAVSAS